MGRTDRGDEWARRETGLSCDHRCKNLFVQGMLTLARGKAAKGKLAKGKSDGTETEWNGSIDKEQQAND